MSDLKVGDRVYHFGQKKTILEVGPPCKNGPFYRVSEFGWFPIQKLKPVIKLTPLVRAMMFFSRINALDGLSRRLLVTSFDYHPNDTRVRNGWTLTGRDFYSYKSIMDADKFIRSIGGLDVARLYTDCDGAYQGRFIRGDDVREALRILGED